MLKLYYLDKTKIEDKIYESLSNEERYFMISNESKKKEKIARDILFKYVIEQENIKEDLVFNKYGKPDFKDKKYHFNISHSKDIVVIAVSNEEVGVDIQKLSTYDDIQLDKLTKRVYNDNDYNFYNTDDNVTFTQIWTIKEAYLKYLGIGLIKNLHDITIDFETMYVGMNKEEDQKFCTFFKNKYMVSIVCDQIDKAYLENSNKLLYEFDYSKINF